MNQIENMHTEQMRQLTDCRYAVLVNLERRLTNVIARRRRGAPFRRSARVILAAALTKMRSDAAYRTLAIHYHVKNVQICFKAPLRDL